MSPNPSRSWLAAQAITTYVEDQSWQIQQIQEAVELADEPNAVWVDSAEVDSWLDSWGHPNVILNSESISRWLAIEIAPTQKSPPPWTKFQRQND